MSNLVLNVLAVVVGPVAAVLITLWYQARKEKRDAQERLFLTLMTYRKAFPPNIEFVNALNVIDVVFASDPKVVELWHSYYANLCQKPQINWEQTNHVYLSLLTEMARVLGYKHLQQIDMDKYYSPIAHEDQRVIDRELQIELLRVLKSTASISIEPRQLTTEIKSEAQQNTLS